MMDTRTYKKIDEAECLEEQMALKINSSSPSFENLIENGCVYVDKTKYLYNMLKVEGSYYFLSRPRRFGKSLTVSTLEAIFKGKRELFKDLYIGKTSYDFKEHPVIHIDFSALEVRQADRFEKTLLYKLHDIANKYNVSLDKQGEVKPVFENLLEKLVQNYAKVVILIDEYDKPLSDNIDQLDEALKIRDILRGFFEVVKASYDYIRFVFITGVTKFSKTSIFSSMNNLIDLSLDIRYAAMLGYTEEELLHYFAESIDEGAKKLDLPLDKYIDKIRVWYDGYRFTPDAERVYNPVAVGRFFDEGGRYFKPYWVTTGGSKLLYDIAKNMNFDIENDILKRFSLSRILNQDIIELATGSANKEKYNSLLFQSGYLTIVSNNKDGSLVSLGFPNKEVERWFSEMIMPLYSGRDNSFDKDLLLDYLENGELDAFIAELKSDFASIPYELFTKYEKTYHLAFYCMLLTLGANIIAESPTNKGRIDATVETGEHIYIFEFKVGQSAKIAIEQIKQNGYAEKFNSARYKGRTMHLVGVSFSLEDRNIDEVVHEERPLA